MRLAIDKIPLLNRLILTSAGYRALTRAEAEKFVNMSRADAWSSAARRQERIYAGLLAEMRAGKPRLDFRAAAHAVTETGIRNPMLLEVGCGNGYYSEILDALVPGGVRYTGLDYSEAMVASARAKYPNVEFAIGDTTNLLFPDNSFDIVMDGVSLMHILAYRRAISEIARVSARFVILHCLPVFDSSETAYLRKYAYGVPVAEIIFGRSELKEILAENGLTIVDTASSLPYDVFHVTRHHSAFETFLCEKKQ